MLSEPARTEIQPGPAGVESKASRALARSASSVVAAAETSWINVPNVFPDLVTLAGASCSSSARTSHRAGS